MGGITHLLANHDTVASKSQIGSQMIGDSAPMREIKAFLLKVAAADSTMLITGGSGTGNTYPGLLTNHHFSEIG